MFKTTTDLLPHQVPAVEKLLPLRVGGLFMDMGTGKTRCAIELIACRQQHIDRAIVYCPVALKEMWADEIALHTDCPRDGVHVFGENTSIRTVPPGAFWYIIGIESVAQSNRVALAADRLTTERAAVIVDESSYIKGHDALRTLRITRYSERARYRLALTGTPISQGVQDLYAQMRFLSPAILGYGSFFSFAANHLEYSDEYPGMILRAHNTAWLAAKTQPYVYQITKEEAGINLPPKRYDARHCWLTRQQQEAYEQAKWEILSEADEVDGYTLFRVFSALQQIASGFWNRNGELIELPHHRLDTLMRAVGDVPAGDKVIIWCKYLYSARHIAAALSQEYGQASVCQFHGELNEGERAAELARWRGEEGRWFVSTAGTGGHGLTLTQSALAIFYENEFKYAHRIQAEDRIHRLGQTRSPLYLDIIARCNIEQRIQDSLRKKGNAVDDFRRKVTAIKRAHPQNLKAEVAKLLAVSA